MQSTITDGLRQELNLDDSFLLISSLAFNSSRTLTDLSRHLRFNTDAWKDCESSHQHDVRVCVCVISVLWRAVVQKVKRYRLLKWCFGSRSVRQRSQPSCSQLQTFLESRAAHTCLSFARFFPVGNENLSTHFQDDLGLLSSTRRQNHHQYASGNLSK